MAVEVILPKVDMDMATGSISAWHVADGTRVKKGQALFDIETDKSAMEIESPGDGILRFVHGETNVALAIGTVVAMIYAEGEAQILVSAATREQVAPVVPKISSEKLIASNNAVLIGVRATPLARRLARQAGVDIAGFNGSGPRGRIVAADIAAVSEKKPAPIIASLTSGGTLAQVRALYAEGSFDLKPLDAMRRTIAQRLVHSKQTVPHFYLSMTCTLDEMLAMRERLNALAPSDANKMPTWKLSVNDFVIKALAIALQRVPAANVTFTDEGILQHRASDIGVAVAVEGGLYTPVVRSAETKTLSAISIEVKDFAVKARARKLQPADYQGGTTAVSNLGMYGVEQFNAIINPPHATILAVGAGIEQFVPLNKLPVLKTQMTCTLSCDHRAVDGVVGAALLQAFKQLIEEPALMLV